MGLSDNIKDPVSNKTLQKVYDTLLHSQNVIRKIGKLEITEEHIKIIKRLMEEKKTKKMTKAEAFEWLKGKKVRTCGEPRLLERKLMECGYRWMRGVTWENDDYEDFWAYFMGYDGLITFVDIECSDYYECHDFEDISADDILSIEIVEEKSEEEDALDLISTVGARLSEVLRRMEGHKHIVITEDDVILYDEGMSLFHSDPF